MKTAECVTPMHPDKICDRISDAFLDACLEQDPDSRVAIETVGSHGIITVSGEVSTKAFVDVKKVVQSIVGDKYGVQVNIHRQSPEIARGVDSGGAGDQGICSGYACNENDAMIPQELYLARHLCQVLYSEFPYDGKTQITLNDKGEILAIVASFQNVPKKVLEKAVFEWLTNQSPTRHTQPFQLFCNSAGDWDIGGFEADTGLTGRKLVVDNYGPQIPIGGGAFSGKDATKVDRSAAYMARKISVAMLKRLDAKQVFTKIAYSIGVADPVMVTCEVDGEVYDMLKMEKDFGIRWQLQPQEIIKNLDLKRPQFEKTAQWGHFGNDFLWDQP